MFLPMYRNIPREGSDGSTKYDQGLYDQQPIRLCYKGGQSNIYNVFNRSTLTH